MTAQRPKLILLITDSFPYGNTEPYLLAEINFIQSGFERLIIVPTNSGTGGNNESLYEIYTPNKSGKLRARTFMYAIKLFLFELPRIIALPGPLKQMRYFLAYLLNCARIASGIVTDLKLQSLKDQYSILVYSYWFGDQAVVSGFIKKEVGINSISRAHGFEIFADQNKNGYPPFINMRLRNTNRVFSVSKFGEVYLKENYRSYKNKVETSYLGTYDHGLGVFDKAAVFTIATCSIIRDVKRLELMPEILKYLKFRLTWHVIGDGPDVDRLKELCKSLPGNVEVVFHGYLSAADIEKFYQSTSVNLLCSLSRSEGLPVSMMEAISYGIPLLSTDVGGCSEICNEHTGILVPGNFETTEVALEIDRFRTSYMNTEAFRLNVRDYWKKNFDAVENYQNFVDRIKDVNSKSRNRK